jgi:hypothetical protein
VRGVVESSSCFNGIVDDLAVAVGCSESINYLKFLNENPKKVSDKILAWAKEQYPKPTDNPFYNKMRDW